MSLWLGRTSLEYFFDCCNFYYLSWREVKAKLRVAAAANVVQYRAAPEE